MHVPMLLLTLGLLTSGPKVEIKNTKIGKGPAAKVGDVLIMEYTGRLKKGGKQFDTSKGRAPFAFVLGAGQVIKGWDQGLLGMKVGGKRTLTIPASLAYGSREMGSDIPANSDLVFDVELVKIMTVKTLRPGKGNGAHRGDQVTLNYRGTLANGKEFDSSYGKTPFQFTLGARMVVQGFDLGVEGMKVGEKRHIEIPPYLGYGERGAGGVIPPNATIIFDLELLEISKG